MPARPRIAFVAGSRPGNLKLAFTNEGLRALAGRRRARRFDAALAFPYALPCDGFAAFGDGRRESRVSERLGGELV